MKKLTPYILICLLIIAVLSGCGGGNKTGNRGPAGDWELVGGSLNASPTGQAWFPNITSSGTTVYVNWREGSDSYFFPTKKYDGTAWIPVGLGNCLVDGDSDSTDAKSSLAIGPDGIPWLVWPILDTVLEIDYYNDSISSWDGVAGSARNIPVYSIHWCRSPQLIFIGETLYVIKVEVSSPDYVQVNHCEDIKADKSSWIKDTSPSSGPSSSARAAVCNSTLYVTWSESNNIYVKHLEGETWVSDGPDGGSLNVDPGLSAGSPDIAFCGTIPYVVWTEKDVNLGKPKIYVKHFNGTKWVQDGDCLSTFGIDPRITSAGNKVYVAYVDCADVQAGKICVKHFNGTKWVQDGGFLNVEPPNPTLAITVRTPQIIYCGRFLYVAWVENSCTLYVKRLAI